MASSSKSLSGQYSIQAASPRSETLPKAIHLRLTEEILNTLLAQSRQAKGKGKAVDQQPSISFTADAANPTFNVGSTSYKLTQSSETGPHEVYSRRNGQTQLSLVAKLSDKMIVQHSLGSNMMDRVRERSEAAVHERDDRRTIALDFDPASTKNGTRSPVLKGLQRPPSRTGSPLNGRAPSPARSESVARKPKLLVASDPNPKRGRSPGPGRHPPHSPSHLNRSFTVEVEDIIPGSEANEALSENEKKAALSNAMNDSSSEAPSFRFSSGSSTSGTSISSGDSPPFKEDFVPIISSTASTSANSVADLSAFGIHQVQNLPKSKPSPVSETKRKAATDKSRSPSQTNQLAVPSAENANLKRKRDSLVAGNSTSDESPPARKSGGPRANSRTSGGARVSRPASKAKATPSSLSASASPQPSQQSAASDSGTASNKNARPSSATSPKKQKKTIKDARAKTWYSSSSENEMDADVDADGEPEEVPFVSAYGRSSAVAPAPAPAQAAKSSTAPQRALFAEKRAKYQTLHSQLVEQKRLIEALVNGFELSASERSSVGSKRELQLKLEAVQQARKELLGLRDYILSQ